MIFKNRKYFEGCVIDFCNSIQVDNYNWIHYIICYKGGGFPRQHSTELFNWGEVKITFHMNSHTILFHVL